MVQPTGNSALGNFRAGRAEEKTPPLYISSLQSRRIFAGRSGTLACLALVNQPGEKEGTCAHAFLESLRPLVVAGVAGAAVARGWLVDFGRCVHVGNIGKCKRRPACPWIHYSNEVTEKPRLSRPRCLPGRRPRVDCGRRAGSLEGAGPHRVGRCGRRRCRRKCGRLLTGSPPARFEQARYSPTERPGSGPSMLGCEPRTAGVRVLVLQIEPGNSRRRRVDDERGAGAIHDSFQVGAERTNRALSPPSAVWTPRSGLTLRR